MDFVTVKIGHLLKKKEGSGLLSNLGIKWLGLLKSIKMNEMVNRF